VTWRWWLWRSHLSQECDDLLDFRFEDRTAPDDVLDDVVERVDLHAKAVAHRGAVDPLD
jgi:hypothetical protein